MRTNLILIDYENVKPEAEALSRLDAEHVKVIVFVGANQKAITFEVADIVQRMGARAEYVQVSGNGPNALDFHIAFYIGQLAAQDPSVHFHIISKDKGFDPLVKHLNDTGRSAARSSDVHNILGKPEGTKSPAKKPTAKPPTKKLPAKKPVAKPASAKSPAEKLAVIDIFLKKSGACKPRSVKTLSSTINALFQKQLSEEEISTLLNALQTTGVIKVDGTTISYEFETSNKTAKQNP